MNLLYVIKIYIFVRCNVTIKCFKIGQIRCNASFIDGYKKFQLKRVDVCLRRTFICTPCPFFKQEIDSVCWTCMSGRCMLEFHKISCWMVRCNCHFNTNLKISFTTCCRTYTSNIPCLFLALSVELITFIYGNTWLFNPSMHGTWDWVWKLLFWKNKKFDFFYWKISNFQ
jgi:hypothetical protein